MLEGLDSLGDNTGTVPNAEQTVASFACVLVALWALTVSVFTVRAVAYIREFKKIVR